MTTGNSGNNRLGGVRGRSATSEEIAQRNGYVQGRSDEYAAQNQMRAQERAIAQKRSDSSAANGLLAGFLIAALAAGVGAALYFLTGDRTTPNPVAVPQTEKETVREKETTIIEREVPTPDVSLPDVQIDVPDINLPDVNVGSESPASEGSADAEVEGATAPQAAEAKSSDALPAEEAAQ